MSETVKQVIILCLTVFFGRIADVSFGSIRTIMLVDGKKYMAALFGFIEVLIWFFVVREALSSTMSGVAGLIVACSYAAGFACGNILGGTVVDKVVGEMLTVHIITSERNSILANKLREVGFAVTEIDCQGRGEKKRKMLYLEIKSNKLDKLKKVVDENDPSSFTTVTKTKVAINGFLK